MVTDMQETARYLTAAEVAVRLKISKRTVHRRALTGAIPAVEKLRGPNGAFLFEPTVIDYLARQAEKATA